MDAGEIGTDQSNGLPIPGSVGNYGYKSEGTACRLHTSQVPGSYPLYRYWKSSVTDHFYTLDSNEIGIPITTHPVPGLSGKHDYVYESIAGYCFKTRAPGTVPLYRYWKAEVGDHFYTTNPSEIGTTTPGEVGNHGYKSEGIACYVYS